jgi:hypothetical protein
VVAAPEAGILMAERSSRSLSDAVRQLQSHYPDRSDTRRYAERFGWHETTTGQLRLFRAVLANYQGRVKHA